MVVMLPMGVVLVAALVIEIVGDTKILPGWQPRERFEASELPAWSEQRHDVVRFPRDLLFE